ncbi:MAG: hypothetical protein LBU51_02420, partial [Bacteroidales bacterium]|nr:hypothetical protein [Bacteroidales bacterium]
MKILMWIFGSFIALDLLLVLLVFISPIQNALIGKVSALLSEKWGSEISAKKIYLSPTLKITVYDFVIKDGNDHDMIRVDKATARIKKIGIKPFVLSFGELNGFGGDVNVVKYRGDDTVNIAKWARKISKKDKKSGFILKADHLTLENSRFCFTNENYKFHTDTSDLMDFGFLELKDINFDAHNFIVRGPDIGADINHLAFNQYTGFSLLESKAKFQINDHELIFTNAQLKTKTSEINLDLHFLYHDWSNFADFVDSVNINTILKPSILDFADVSCWVNPMRGMDEKVYLSGNVINSVNNLSVNDLRCFINANTEICGDFHMRNITDFSNAYFDVNLCESKLNFNELDSLTLPKGKRISLPQQVKRVGNSTFEGYFKGYLTDFKSDIILCSDAGDAHVNFSCNDLINKEIDYNGEVNLTGFNLGLLLGENKFFGKTSLALSLDGTAHVSNLLATAKAEISGKIASFDMVNYPLHLVTIEGGFGKKVFHVELESKDPNIDFDFSGAIDLSSEKPVYKANMVLNNFVPYVLAKNFSVVDTAKGFDKIIHYYQKHPSSTLSFSALELNLRGNNLDNLNGFVGFDGLSYSVDGKQLVGERLRLTMVNVEETIHKFILASSIVNATITTNYNLNVIIDSLIGVAYHYVPNFLPARKTVENSPPEKFNDEKEYYFRMHAETFNTRNILSFFVPNLRISSGTSVSLVVNSLHRDSIELHSNRIRYGEKMSVNNLNLKGNIAPSQELLLTMNCDSLVFHQKKNNFVFSGIRWASSLADNKLAYQLNWFNPQMLFNKSASIFAGTVDGSSKEDIVFKITDALLDFQGNQWTFNKEHVIHLLPDALTFDNVALQTKNSSLSANGIFSFKQKDNLNLDLVNFNLEQINFLLASRNISFGGNLSAQIKLDTWHLERIITGKMLIDDFMFNEAPFGHLFLAGAAPGVQKVNFGGGLFQKDEPFNSSIIDHYSYSDYQKETHKLAKLTGTYSLAQKNLEVTADVDTLDISFLSPFLASFSNIVKGKANGEITFIANTDSLYFKGIVNVIEGELGIAPLNTIYKLKNQKIGFDQKGLHFDNIQLTDIRGNKASIRGEVLHKKFKD